MKTFERVPVFVWLLLYVLINGLLIWSKVKPYQGNFSFLIGIWQGFAHLNPDYTTGNFIILKNGGYDGQFFYLVAKFLYNELPLPQMDAFFLRFHRIGLPILAGFFSKWLGFSFYPQISLILLHGLHIWAFFCLRALLSSQNKSLALFFLFSPFIINSNLLLVCDSLFASFFIFTIFFLNRAGLVFFQCEKKEPAIPYLVFSLLSAIFLVAIRETGLFLIFAIALSLLYTKKSLPSLFFLMILVLYFLLTSLSKKYLPAHPGTNPLSYFQLIDYPFFGLFKSLGHLQTDHWKDIIRGLGKLPIFFYFLLLIGHIRHLKTINQWIVYSPVLAILAISAIAEQGYWLSFDNISRMFVVSTPILLLVMNDNKQHRNTGILIFHPLLLALILFRVLLIQPAMQWTYW